MTGKTLIAAIFGGLAVLLAGGWFLADFLVDSKLKARVDPGIPTGVVFIPFCYAEAPGNVLTNPALDPFGKIPEFKYCAARVMPTGKVGAPEGDLR